MSAPVLIVTVLVLAAVAVTVFLLANANRGRRLMQDVPPALRPGYSDEELERSVLERYMAWGLLLSAFFAVFLPVYWLRETPRINAQTEAAFVASFQRGEHLYELNCSLCHGRDAEGGGTASTYDPADTWPAPNLTTIVKRYEGSPVTDIEEYIETTLHKGRPGTPMPAWGVEYGGPMTDQEISDITDWILANQKAEADEASPATGETGEALYQTNCVRCHGRQLEGFIGPSLIGVFERHSRETVLGILRNGIYLANGVSMPPWQTGYMYPETRYTDEALGRIVDYLESQQPATPPEGAERYNTPYSDGGPQQGENTREGGTGPGATEEDPDPTIEGTEGAEA